MKTILWIWVLAMASAPCPASTTFIITSELEGDINAPWFILPDEDGDNGVRYRGDSVDYLRFRVAQTTTVTISTLGQGLKWMFGGYIGREDVFAGVGFNSVFVPRCSGFPCSPESLFERHYFDIGLVAGDYVVSTSVYRDDTGNDDDYSNQVSLGHGYRAANPGGGGFFRASYGYEITGDIELVNFWHGHIDRTWTKTYYIPEPTSLLLGLAAAFPLLARRRR